MPEKSTGRDQITVSIDPSQARPLGITTREELETYLADRLFRRAGVDHSDARRAIEEALRSFDAVNATSETVETRSNR